MPQIPLYEALSYAWGDPKATETIYLHNQHSSTTSSLGITSNCARALRQLRYPDSERLIWVDAICINQANIEERSAQVRIMHRIYSNASHVLIYLGDSSVDSDKAIGILEDDAGGRRPWTTDNLDHDEVTALKNLLHRPWFHRVWVLQEVACSRSARVICGSRITPWRETFHKAHSSSIGHIEKLRPLPYVMSFGESRLIDTMTPEGLFRELRNARDCASTDAKDKIYALLELFQERPHDKRLTIDYTRNLTDLFTDVAEYLLEHMGPSVLSERYGDSRINGLPSWVPDWTV
ncbi:HET-domain-containing protein, partial [Coniochaeta sp. PMI_546]